MDTVTYIKERSRMCNANCLECPLSNKNNGTSYSCRDFTNLFPEKTISIIEKWSKEHPQKTMLKDFLEKYPNAPLNDWGMPLRVCPIDLGYEDRTTQSCFDECADCWNRPIGE